MAFTKYTLVTSNQRNITPTMTIQPYPKDGSFFDHHLPDGDFDSRAASFKIQHGVLNFSHDIMNAEDKCAWLRSQLIGKNVEFDTPYGKRLLTYADHTASGRCLHHVENYIRENVLPFYGNTHTDDSFVGRLTSKMVKEAANYIKTCMGGGEEDALLFCGSGTTAGIKRLQEVMGLAIPSIMRSRVIKQLKPEERWVVFVGPYEHHSNLLSWRESLAEVVEIGVDENGLIDMETLRQELGSSKYTNRPMLGSFSACSNVTGILADTRGIARLLHEHGAFACFDFAACGPYAQIDFRAGEMDSYDAVFLSPHKFVGGPGTPGIVLMRKNLYYLGLSPPSTCGGGTVRYVNGFSEKDTLYYEPIEEREDAGTPPIIQKIRAALTFWVKKHMGHHLIETQESLWTERALKRLLPNPNINVLGNTEVKRQPIISFLINTTSSDGKQDKPLQGRFITKLINDLFGIQTRGGCACAGPYGHILLKIDKKQSLAMRAAIEKGYIGIKLGWARLSFIYYMSITEFEFILAAIEFIALYGQRFVPMYHFDWKTGDWMFKKNTEYIPGALSSKNDSTQSSNSSTKTMEDKYNMYLETALNIAHSLPKYPQPRPIPEEISPDLVTFRI